MFDTGDAKTDGKFSGFTKDEFFRQEWDWAAGFNWADIDDIYDEDEYDDYDLSDFDYLGAGTATDIETLLQDLGYYDTRTCYFALSYDADWDYAGETAYFYEPYAESLCDMCPFPIGEREEGENDDVNCFEYYDYYISGCYYQSSGALIWDVFDGEYV